MDLDSPSGRKKEKKLAFYDVAFNYVAGFDIDAIARKAGLAPELVQVVVPVVDEQEDEEDDDEEMEVKEEVVEKKGWGFGLFGRK